MQACDLLDKALAERDFPPGEPSKIGSDNGCEATNPDIGSYSLDLQVGATIDSFGDDQAKIHDGEIHGRRAVQVRAGLDIDGSCEIAMAVKPNARAIISLVRREHSTEKACKIVERVAKKIEPLLPGNS